MARLIAAVILAAAVLSGCSGAGGPSPGVYGGADAGGDIRR